MANSLLNPTPPSEPEDYDSAADRPGARRLRLRPRPRAAAAVRGVAGSPCC